MIALENVKSVAKSTVYVPYSERQASWCQQILVAICWPWSKLAV